MGNSKINRIDFDFFERSKLESMTYRLCENLHYIFVCHSKDYTQQLLQEHQYIVAGRKIYHILSGKEFVKNAGVALEWFLIDYLENAIKLDKRESYKWEHNGIDIFHKHLGIQITTENKPHHKHKELQDLRSKINSGENLFYREEYENGDVYKIVIPNREVPKRLGLFIFESKIIKGLVNSKNSNRFLVNIKKMSKLNFIKLHNEFEIISKSFPFIIERINYIENNREKRINYIPQTQEQSVLFNQEQYEQYIDKVNKWTVGGMVGNKPKEYQYSESNITYKYDPEQKAIKFKVYSTRDKTKQNRGNLVYSFFYYLCDKITKNNSFVEPVLIHQSDDRSHNILNKSHVTSLRIKIQKKIGLAEQKIIEAQRKVNKTDINEEKIINRAINRFLQRIKKGNKFKQFKEFFSGLDNEYKAQQSLYLEQLKMKNQEVIDIQKNITWLKSFIADLKRILDGENIEITEIGNGIITDEELIFNDPIITSSNLLSKSIKLTYKYQKLLRYFKDIDDIGITQYKFSISLQKMLFLSNTKSKGGNNSIKKFLTSLENRIIANKKRIKDLKSNKHKEDIAERKAGILIDKNKIEKKQNEITKLQNENTKLETLKNSLNDFVKDIISLREEIRKINFNKLLVSNLNRHNIVYSNKFLSNIIISMIFKGDHLNIRNMTHQKLVAKIKTLLNTNSLDIENFLKLVELYISFQDTLEYNHITQVKSKIGEGVNILEEKLLELENRVSFDTDTLLSQLHGYFNIVKNISEYLKELFPNKVIENHKVSITYFVTLFFGKKKLNFETEFKELIKNIGIDNIQDFTEKGGLIQQFYEFKNHILKFNSFEIDVNNLKTIDDFQKAHIKINQELEDTLFKAEQLKNIKSSLNT